MVEKAKISFSLGSCGSHECASALCNPACLTSSCSFFLIPSLTPEQTFFSFEALGSTECLVVKLVSDFIDTHFS